MNAVISFDNKYCIPNLKLNLVKEVLMYEDKIDFIYFEEEEEKKLGIETRKTIANKLIDYYSIGDFSTQKVRKVFIIEKDLKPLVHIGFKGICSINII